MNENRKLILLSLDGVTTAERLTSGSWRWVNFVKGSKPSLNNPDVSALMRSHLIEERGGLLYLTSAGSIVAGRILDALKKNW